MVLLKCVVKVLGNIMVALYHCNDYDLIKISYQIGIYCSYCLQLFEKYSGIEYRDQITC